ncbi:MAG: amidohydrolase [Gemmatimonadaceae bacterium]|nr:amidohydrolase [Chitinophagaceae bacterium]
MRYLYSISILFLCLNSVAQQAELVLLNGNIFTADNLRPYAEAIAITGNTIMAVGSNAEILNMAGPNSRRINLKGKTVIPGINDAHYHHSTLYNARTIVYPKNGEEPKWKSITDSIVKITKKLDSGKIICGYFGSDIATDTSINRNLLDQFSVNHPIFLFSYWGHTTILNSAAIKYIGLDEHCADPKGGYFERFKDTNLINGRVHELAQFSLDYSKLTSPELFSQSLKNLSKEALQYGITTIQNMCTAGSPKKYSTVLDENIFPLRMRLIRWCLQNSDGTLAVPDATMMSKEFGSPLFSVSGTKWMLDGTPIDQRSEIREGYRSPDGWHGKMNFTPADIDSFLCEASRRNDQVMFHVAGDKTLECLLDAMERQTSIDWPEKRVRIEHGDGILPDLMERVKKLGLIVVQNPTHFSSVILWHERYKGAMEEFAMPLRSLIRNDIPVALGSDGPLNPFLNIMLACLHPYNLDEALTVEEAVIAYTSNSAYAEMTERWKGRLVRGMVADLAVLNQDIFSVPLHRLPATVSLLTIVDGKIVYEKK